MIPFIWIFEKILRPIIEFISIPFIWLWEKILEPLISLIAIPLAWFFNVVLAPVFKFLFSYVLKPIFLALVAAIAGSIMIFPIVAIGSVLSKSIKDTFASKYTNDVVFSYGVGIGFLLFDIVCVYSIFHMGYSTIRPSLVIFLSIILSIVFLFRFFILEKKTTIVKIVFRNKISNYWKTSKLQFATQVCLLPIVIVLSLFFPREE
jgi:hypothetical protein